MLRYEFSFSADTVIEPLTNKPGKGAAKYVKNQLLPAVDWSGFADFREEVAAISFHMKIHAQWHANIPVNLDHTVRPCVLLCIVAAS